MVSREHKDDYYSLTFVWCNLEINTKDMKSMIEVLLYLKRMSLLYEYPLLLIPGYYPATHHSTKCTGNVPGECQRQI